MRVDGRSPFPRWLYNFYFTNFFTIKLNIADVYKSFAVDSVTSSNNTHLSYVTLHKTSIPLITERRGSISEWRRERKSRPTRPTMVLNDLQKALGPGTARLQWAKPDTHAYIYPAPCHYGDGCCPHVPIARPYLLSRTDSAPSALLTCTPFTLVEHAERRGTNTFSRERIYAVTL